MSKNDLIIESLLAKMREAVESMPKESTPINEKAREVGYKILNFMEKTTYSHEEIIAGLAGILGSYIHVTERDPANRFGHIVFVLNIIIFFSEDPS